MAGRFHLVLATRGRTAELERFLRSLEQQGRKDVRLSVVDQNEDDRLAPLLARYSGSLRLEHLRSAPGASRARNAGLGGEEEIVTFPDDDCWYPPGLLDRIDELLRTNEDWHGVTVRSVGADGAPSVARWDARAGDVTRTNAWFRGLNFTIFLRREAVRAVGPFDESLGVGSDGPWQSGEETDYLLRAVERGLRVAYRPEIAVCHDEPTTNPGRDVTGRARGYGLGTGRVLRKHGYPGWYAVYFCLRPVLGALVALARGRAEQARFRLAVARGRFDGWRA